MKDTDLLKSLEEQAKDELQALLAIVPRLQIETIDNVARAAPDHGVDLILRLTRGGARHDLYVEVKSKGQPRIVRAAAYQLLHYTQATAQPDVARTPVFVAPYLSPAVRDICRSLAICYLDFEGNCWLQFGDVFIDHRAPPKPKAERRELRSVFAPKSAQVLRAMVREPQRAWRLVDLAQTSHVSIGHVSNVKQALIDHEWAEADDAGLRLTHLNALLDAWRDAYDPPKGREFTFHTVYHGAQLKSRISEALRAANDHGAAMLAAFSAADWLAAYARTPTEFFYADEAGLERLREVLNLRAVEQGGNIIITIPDDHDLFLDKTVVEPGIVCTSPVQTYLDLSQRGDRGAEAADHLRNMLLKGKD
jgi:hypothetical protein